MLSHAVTLCLRVAAGFCKQQLWPLLHYVLPMATSSAGRFDDELWQAYIKANKMFAEQVVECAASDSDSCWIHDYHLLVLPSLLRKRYNRIRCGVFLHSPFPSSEIFRTFPKREELLRSMLNADVIGMCWGRCATTAKAPWLTRLNQGLCPEAFICAHYAVVCSG
jgi:trehalose-6-phosphate synthase